MRSHLSARGLGAIVAVASMAGSAFAGNLIEFRTVALSGQQAPGAGSDATYSSIFPAPSISNSGKVAFSAKMEGGSIDTTNDVAIWRGSPGSLSMVARDGEALPGLGAGVVRTLAVSIAIYLNESGAIAFGSGLSGGGVTTANNSAVWSDQSGNLSVALRKGDAAPGVGAGVVFTDWGKIAFNDAGQIAFMGTISGPGVTSTRNTGIWSQGSGSLELIARERDLMPGVSNQAFEVLLDPALNNAGKVVFGSQGTYVWGRDAGVFTNRSGVLTGNAVSTSAFRAVINSGNDIAGMYGFGEWTISGWQGYRPFRSSRSGPTNPIEPVYMVGSSVPVINGQGRVAYIGAEGSGFDPPMATRIVCADITGVAAVLAREGNQAMDAAVGQNYSTFGSIAINDLNQVIFSGTLTGPGVTSANNNAIWMFTAFESRMLLRTGDLFDVNDDPMLEDLRTMSGFLFLTSSGGEDGLASGFNDHGELALRISFVDGSSGLFVIAVPAPGSAAALLLPAAVLASRRRRKYA